MKTTDTSQRAREIQEREIRQLKRTIQILEKNNRLLESENKKWKHEYNLLKETK